MDELPHAPRHGVRGGIASTAVLCARRLLDSHGRLTTTVGVDGYRLVLPLSHDLPLHQWADPVYSRNLGRLAACLHAADASLTVVDVGANVGDSAALIRAACPAPILCIEGHPDFLPYLRRNVEHWRDLEIEPQFVGPLDGSATLRTSGGTARIVGTDSAAESISTSSLADILAKHPRFSEVGLLKIDTDGFDFAIMRDAAPVLEKSRPVVFFEFDPSFYPDTDDVPEGIRALLRELGYTLALVWLNNGEFLCTMALEDSMRWEELTAFLSSRGTSRYADIAVFPNENADRAYAVRDHELAYFRALGTADGRYRASDGGGA